MAIVDKSARSAFHVFINLPAASLGKALLKHDIHAEGNISQSSRLYIPILPSYIVINIPGMYHRFDILDAPETLSFLSDLDPLLPELDPLRDAEIPWMIPL